MYRREQRAHRPPPCMLPGGNLIPASAAFVAIVSRVSVVVHMVAEFCGVYGCLTSPTSLPSPLPTGVSACTAGLLCRRCWASTSSPTGLPSPPPTGVFACTAGLLCHRLLGVYVLTDRLAFATADWCLRLHGWPIMPPLLGVYVFTDRAPRSSLTSVFVYTVGWSHLRCWASTSLPTDRLVRRRLVFSPARLVGHTTVVGHLRLHRRLAFAAADWCLRLHGWPIMPPLLGIYVFTNRPPHMTPTGDIIFTAGHVAATANRHHHLQRKLLRLLPTGFFTSMAA
uniref:cysteine dioxygenase n=1 Tax=Oryza sativa subsp. japonica TaxID=39947 RepID=A0A4V0P190_ORYSJ|nr:hypothetical protein [Oryza sativa Japonica Group]